MLIDQCFETVKRQMEIALFDRIRRTVRNAALSVRGARIDDEDTNILRELGKVYAEIASDPVNDSRKPSGGN